MHRVANLSLPIVLFVGLGQMPGQTIGTFPSAGSSQTIPAPTSPAEAVLLQALATVGTLATTGPNTQIHLTGTVSYSWAGTQVPGTLAAVWDSKNGLQVSTVTSLGSRTETTDGQQVTSTDEKHHVTTLGSHTASRSQLRYLPSLDLATILAVSQKQLALGTPTQVNGSQVDVVRISGVWPTNAPTVSDSEVTFYVDAGTHVIVRRDDRVEATSFSPGKLTRTMTYSDYRKVDGISLPFTISELLNGQALYTITLTSISVQ